MQTLEELIQHVQKQDARIEAHAKAIRDLRKRLAAMEPAPAREPEPARSSPEPVSRNTGQFVPQEICAMCGGPKPSARTALTCRECSAKRNKIIREKLDRAPLLRESCFNCGKAFKKQARILCPKCSESFALWKAT